MVIDGGALATIYLLVVVLRHSGPALLTSELLLVRPGRRQLESQSQSLSRRRTRYIGS